jgi:ribosomal protein S8
LPLHDTINIKAINDVLIKQGYIHDTDYIANVDLGVEMYNSLGGNRGQLVINQFAVSVEPK